MTGNSTASSASPARSNLWVRLISALALGPVVLALVIVGGLPFTALVIVLAVVSLLEFYALGRERDIPGNAAVGLAGLVGLFWLYSSGQTVGLLILLAAVGGAVAGWEFVRGRPAATAWGRAAVTVGGLAYAGLPAAFLSAIRALPDALIWFAFIICVTWGTDTLAYFGGRWWGKRPLAPRISPKKTVEGAVVGLACGFAAGAAALALAGKLSAGTLLLALLAPPLAVIGDLFESLLKRYFGVKDSHLARLNLIPGHGGVLDRTDSLVWVTTLVYGYLALAGS